MYFHFYSFFSLSLWNGNCVNFCYLIPRKYRILLIEIKIWYRVCFNFEILFIITFVNLQFEFFLTLNKLFMKEASLIEHQVMGFYKLLLLFLRFWVNLI